MLMYSLGTLASVSTLPDVPLAVQNGKVQKARFAAASCNAEAVCAKLPLPRIQHAMHSVACRTTGSGMSGHRHQDASAHAAYAYMACLATKDAQKCHQVAPSDTCQNSFAEWSGVQANLGSEALSPGP